MPKVDPNTRQIYSDDPSHPDDEIRGGRTAHDPSMRGATPTGGGFTLKTPKEHSYKSAVLPGEKTEQP